MHQLSDGTAQPARPNVLIGSCGAVDVLHLSDFLAAFGKIAASTRVILTGAAQRFVTVDAVEALTRNPVATDEHRGDVLVPHINLPAWADLFVVVPATANILAKAAHGIADDLLSTTILAAEPPIFFVPSMNVGMWRRPAVQRNVATLEADGHHVLRAPRLRTALEVATGEWVETELMPTPVDLLDAIADRLPAAAGVQGLA